MKKSGSYKNLRKSSFVARNSRLDTDSLTSTLSEFRGFVVLFWVAIGISMANTVTMHWRYEGSLVRLGLFKLLSKDLLVLGLSHLTMLASLFFAVPLTKLFVNGCIKNKWLFYLVQTAVECSFLYFCIYWALYRTWPWPQAVTFSMHSVAMLMKVHSYISCNAEFELFRREVGRLEGSMKKQEGDCLETKQQIETLKLEMSKGSTTFPENMTLANYVDYLLVPTLVYELEYPRTDNIRIHYIIEKIVATIGIVAILYLSVEHYISPVLEDMHNETLLETILQLLIPYMVGWIMIFYVIFECVCNAFAEMTRFADREFYQDWWNSTSFDEMARKWNKPVHEFLLRHIYLEAIDHYKLSKSNATFITFLFSSILHELVVFMASKKIKFIFFFFQMFQLPLIWFMRSPFLRKRPLFANAIFWICLMFGMPFITIMYTRDIYYQQTRDSVTWNLNLW